MGDARISRLPAAAVVAAGCGAVLGAGLLGLRRLLLHQGAAADLRVRPLTTAPPPIRETYGDPADPSFTLAMLGDSSAQGVGVDDFDETLGGWAAARLAAAGRYVRVVSAAENGTRAEHLAAQIATVLPYAPDLVLISTGANDVLNRTHPGKSARLLADAVRRLRAAGIPVVVGTTPNLGVVTAVDAPLRQIAGVASRLLERAQIAAVRKAGGVVVPLGTILSPVFAADRSMFAADGFHPSAKGYAVVGQHLLDALEQAAAAAPGG
jgi:lysophospholipase L1-like esterase